jgi:hypothetical protein
VLGGAKLSSTGSSLTRRLRIGVLTIDRRSDSRERGEREGLSDKEDWGVGLVGLLSFWDSEHLSPQLSRQTEASTGQGADSERRNEGNAELPSVNLTTGG